MMSQQIAIMASLKYITSDEKQAKKLWGFSYFAIHIKGIITIAAGLLCPVYAV
jgi:hypothetical protein